MIAIFFILIIKMTQNYNKAISSQINPFHPDMTVICLLYSLLKNNSFILREDMA